MAEKGYILCVDDDLALLENLWQQILDLHGGTHEVVMAKSGTSAALQEMRSLDRCGTSRSKSDAQ